jgi:hypothetical protein
MDRFYNYLIRKRDHTLDMLSVFGQATTESSKDAISAYQGDLHLLEDIIHHYELFVKGSEEEELEYEIQDSE